MKIKLGIILVSYSLFSCINDKENISDYLYTTPEEYWVENDEYYQNTYRNYAYQFYDNQTYNFFVILNNKKIIYTYDNDDIEYMFPEKLYLNKDSCITILGHKHKILKINDSIMLLSTLNGDVREFFKKKFPNYKRE